MEVGVGEEEVEEFWSTMWDLSLTMRGQDRDMVGEGREPTTKTSPSRDFRESSSLNWNLSDPGNIQDIFVSHSVILVIDSDNNKL